MAEGEERDLGRVLVTGANGHLGRRLVARLCAEAVEVRAVVRSERAKATLRDAVGEAPEVRILDYTNAEQLAEAAQGCHHAVHLVGIIKETRANRYENAHEAPSEALARAADGAGMRRIVYLSIPGSDPASRNACLASKGRAERILLAAKTPAVVLRVPMVLGEGDDTARIVRIQALARFLPLVGGGANHAQPIYAGDVVEAILQGLARPGLEDLALDLGGPESLPQRAFIERAAALHGRRPTVLPIPLGLVRALAAVAERLSAEPPITRAMLDVITHDDRIDAESARRRLGIELTPLDETLRRCVGPEATS